MDTVLTQPPASAAPEVKCDKPPLTTAKASDDDSSSSSSSDSESYSVMQDEDVEEKEGCADNDKQKEEGKSGDGKNPSPTTAAPPSSTRRPLPTTPSTDSGLDVPVVPANSPAHASNDKDDSAPTQKPGAEPEAAEEKPKYVKWDGDMTGYRIGDVAKSSEPAQVSKETGNNGGNTDVQATATGANLAGSSKATDKPRISVKLDVNKETPSDIEQEEDPEWQKMMAEKQPRHQNTNDKVNESGKPPLQEALAKLKESCAKAAKKRQEPSSQSQAPPTRGDLAGDSGPEGTLQLGQQTAGTPAAPAANVVDGELQEQQEQGQPQARDGSLGTAKEDREAKKAAKLEERRKLKEAKDKEKQERKALKELEREKKRKEKEQKAEAKKKAKCSTPAAKRKPKA